jgi:hypothetical protein
MKNKHLYQLLLHATGACALAGMAQAGVQSAAASTGGKAVVGKQPAAVAQPKEESAFDKLWGLATIYKNKDNAFLEELAITGRYHGQYWNADSGSQQDDDWDNRRFRLGMKAIMFNELIELKAEMLSDLNSGGDFYEGFTDLYVAIKPDKDMAITIGKQKPKFGWEWSLSSRLIPTFERGALINQFRPDYAPGISISGKQDKLSWYVGAFSDQVDGEFGQFDGGWSFVASLGYDVKDIVGTEKATARLDFIHSERDSADSIYTAFDNGVSASLEIKQGAFGLVTELLAGFGDSSNFGLIVIPTYNITDQLQLVGRYQLGLSNDDGGLAPLRRYEKAVGATNGDVYNAAYLGLNYFIYEHKLKLMTGVEYANMSGGESTWTYLAGVRVYW